MKKSVCLSILLAAFSTSILTTEVGALGVADSSTDVNHLCDKEGLVRFDVRPKVQYDLDAVQQLGDDESEHLSYEINDLLFDAWRRASELHKFPKEGVPFEGSEMEKEAEKIIRRGLSALNVQRGINLSFSYLGTNLLSYKRYKKPVCGAVPLV